MKAERSIVMSPGVRGFAPVGARLAPAPGPDPQALAAEQARQVEEARRQAAAATAARLRAEFEQERAQARAAEARRWDALAAAFSAFQQSVESQVADQLIKMAVRVAAVILRRELPDAAMLGEVIRETLAPISDLQGAAVRLHPDDAERLRALRGAGEAPRVSDRLEIVADPGLRPGDALIESRNGYFDARIEQRLKLLEEKLRERYRSAHAHQPPT